MVLVKGAFTGPVIRFLREELYARDLAQFGRARFTRMDLFQQAEGIRRDDSEGLGQIARGMVPFITQDRVPVEAQLESEVTNPVYILCFSETSGDLPALAGRFECAYGVEFANPALLNTALRSANFEIPPNGRTVISLHVEQVRYDKGRPRRQPDIRQIILTAVSQKPSCFASEKEWRLAVILSGGRVGAPEYIDGTIPIDNPAIVRRF